ncbi:winged helix-turn-helix transcriptional regulator [Natronomonas marina]|uniref:winged helix-turn-helix transcriptional regulator n=1 Tax=Natronomonas marina TaxID=2961939 RepID=UPI0020CA1095|nr:winged helix-turn-helix transcriptional regulator [Natronomonas marina]
MSDVRARIERRVHEDPGIHFNELVRELDLAAGQVQYHVRRLTDGGSVAAAELFGRTHYYPPEYDEWERRALALLRRETSAEIVATLLDEGPSRPVDVAERVGIARSTLAWHTDRLVGAGLVEKRYDGHQLVVADERRTAELLETADPSLPERLVDRFTRLVDALLE